MHSHAYGHLNPGFTQIGAYSHATFLMWPQVSCKTEPRLMDPAHDEDHDLVSAGDWITGFLDSVHIVCSCMKR